MKETDRADNPLTFLHHSTTWGIHLSTAARGNCRNKTKHTLRHLITTACLPTAIPLQYLYLSSQLLYLCCSPSPNHILLTVTQSGGPPGAIEQRHYFFSFLISEQLPFKTAFRFPLEMDSRSSQSPSCQRRASQFQKVLFHSTDSSEVLPTTSKSNKQTANRHCHI